MQTWPCGHRVVCRKCLVRTIQIAVSRRSLPLRCVVCRARVLRLKRSSSEGRAAADDRDPGVRPATASATASAAAGGRSYSLPVKLQRHATAAAAVAAVAVRSRSVGPGKTGHRHHHGRRSAAGGRSDGRRRDGAAGWAYPFAADDEDDGSGGGGGGGHGHDDDDDDDDDDEGDGGHDGTSIKYSKLDAADRRHGSQSKTGLQRILGKFKFWKFLHFKNDKP